MFEVTATRFHATTQTFVPLINSVVDDTLLQNGPLVKASSATMQRALGHASNMMQDLVKATHIATTQAA